jgi:murein DD-endopeptidase MepM/ murein hydrolase activator NlpD
MQSKSLRSKPLSVFSFPDEKGSFGAIRKYDIHTGIDLYAKEGDPVFSIEDGEVISIENFTGEWANPPTTFWNNTKAILVKCKNYTILYGELAPTVEVGDFVFSGQKIGTLLTVLKKDKGRPMTMLHLEVYTDAKESVTWPLEKEKPANLLDPSFLLEGFK